MEFDHWDKLVYGIERGECILFLGPQLPLTLPDGKKIIPADDLCSRLSSQIEHVAGSRITSAHELAQLSQLFLSQEGDVGLEMEVTRWNETYRNTVSPLHDDLAALPFQMIVTSGHDPLMEEALTRIKNPSLERYHYKGKNKELLAEPSVETPILFYLYGCVTDPSSLVVTETQLLDFLAALIAKDPPLPHDLNATLTNGRLFLFLGFGLNQWYLRILLHVLKILRQGSRTFAVEIEDASANTSLENAVIFYRQNFKVDIVKGDVFAFVKELRSRCSPPLEDNTTQPLKKDTPSDSPSGKGPTVFLCHASEDKGYAAMLHEGLTRAGFAPWLDTNSLRGGDQWDSLIESTIEKVNYFVVLNSHNLLNKSKGISYVNKEIKVALRAEDWRMGKFIIPLSLDSSPLLEQLGSYHAINFTSQSEGLKELIRAIKRDSAKL